jgi:hypothetical protein
MKDKETFYIDNNGSLLEMYRHDRTTKNLVAWNKYGVIAKFMELLMPTVEQLKKGESISITVEKQ